MARVWFRLLRLRMYDDAGMRAMFMMWGTWIVCGLAWRFWIYLAFDIRCFWRSARCS